MSVTSRRRRRRSVSRRSVRQNRGRLDRIILDSPPVLFTASISIAKHTPKHTPKPKPKHNPKPNPKHTRSIDECLARHYIKTLGDCLPLPPRAASTLKSSRTQITPYGYVTAADTAFQVKYKSIDRYLTHTFDGSITIRGYPRFSCDFVQTTSTIALTMRESLTLRGSEKFGYELILTKSVTIGVPFDMVRRAIVRGLKNDIASTWHSEVLRRFDDTYPSELSLLPLRPASVEVVEDDGPD